jgi:transmembrane sensor
MITAGQFAVLSHETNILTMTSADNENPLAWKDHRLVFRKASLQKVVSALQDYFKVKIKVRNPDLLRCRITSVFTDPSLEEVMETLQETLHLRVAKQNNGYEVDGNGCY